MRKLFYAMSMLLAMTLIWTGCSKSDPPGVKKFTITFNSQGGSNVSSMEIDEGAKITEPANPTKGGFIFVGWFKEATYVNVWDFSSDVVTAKVTLYAKWATDEYTVTFQTNGGSSIDPVKVAKGATFKAPLPPSKVDVAFDGWFKEATYVNAWNFSSDVVTANMTLYAKWTTDEYTVTFQTNGGSSINPVKVAKGATFKAPLPPSKVDVAFYGWFKEAALTTEWDFSSDVVNANMTLYANWTSVTLELLQELINEANSIKSSDYTKESYTRMSIVLWEIEGVGSNPESTQSEIVAAYKRLQEAIDELVANPVREAVSIRVWNSIADGFIYVHSGIGMTIGATAMDAKENDATDSRVTFTYDEAKLATWADGAIRVDDDGIQFLAKPALTPGETIVITIASVAKPAISTTVTLRVAAEGELKTKFINEVNKLPEPANISYNNYEAIYNLYGLYWSLSYDEREDAAVQAAYAKLRACDEALEDLPARISYSFSGNVCTFTNSDFGYTITFKADFVANGAFPQGTYTTQDWEQEKTDYYYQSRLELKSNGEGLTWIRTSENANGTGATDWEEEDDLTYTYTGSKNAGGVFYLTYFDEVVGPPIKEPSVRGKSAANATNRTTRLFKR